MGASPTRISCLLLLAAAGCGGSARQAAQPMPSPTGGVVTDEGAPDPYGLRYPYTEADVEFMAGMISHHAQAIAMSRLAPTHGASETILTLAGRVINAQNDEINLIGQWLRDRKLPVPDASPTGMKMVMNGVEHEMLMPGMLTPEQMTELDQARGPAFDELFLTFMIQHHRGAVAMVEKLFATPGAGQDEIVFKFASDVNVDQTTEIARMEKTLFLLKVKRANP